MGDFNDILKYLRYTRRTEEKEARSTTRPAIIIGPDFDRNAPFHEKDFIYVSKEDIKNNSGYYTLLQLINTYASRLYIKRSSSGEIEYYFKRTVNENGEDVQYVKKLPFGTWVQNSSDVFKEVEIDHSVYYSMELERFIYLPLNEVFLFPEQFVYSPKDIEKLPSETYTFKFKDVKGYTGEGFDFGYIDPTGYWKAQLEISEALRKVDFIKEEKAGLVHLLPKLDLNCNRTQLQYNYYEKGMTSNSIMGEPALQLKFKHFSAQLLYLNRTIFYYFDALDDFEVTKERQAFFDDYMSFVDNLLYTANHSTILEILYYVPTFFFKKLDKSFLWKVLDRVLENAITNAGVDTEDVVLQLLKGLAAAEANGDAFLLKLIENRPEKHTRFEVLYEKMNGVSFISLVQFLYRVWDQSTFKYDITNPIFKKSNGPLLIPYKSKKFMGFYSSNKNFEFLKDNHISITEDESIWDNMSIVFGPKAKDAINLLIEEQNNYTYHYYHPLMLTDVVQDSVIPIPKVIPAFFLKANEDKSYWSNVITGIEYGVDVLTTLSGVGNIAKFRHLTKLAKVASKASKFNKAKNYANAVSKIRLAAGVIEISSGTVNGLIKLANLENSPFWKELSTLLFWLELLSLGGELTAAIKGGLRKSADDLLKYEDEIIERANREGVEDVDGLIDELDYLKDSGIKVVGPGGKGYLGGQRLGRAQIRVWIKYIDEISEGRASFKIVEEGDTLYKKLELENAQAGFDPDKLQIVIKKGFTEFEIFHEVKHLEECLKLGKDEYIKGMAKYGGSWEENLLRTYKRELYVYRRVIENRFKFNKAELEKSKKIILNIEEKLKINRIEYSHIKVD